MASSGGVPTAGWPRCFLAALLIGLVGTSGGAQPDFLDQSRESGLLFEHDSGARDRFYFVEIMGPGSGLFDADGDGDLDVYFPQGHPLGTDAAPAKPGVLLRNELRVGSPQSLRFSPGGPETGLGATGYQVGVACADFDHDGLEDLYVTELGANALWKNMGDGTFRNVAEERGVAGDRWSVSATFADVDQDGDVDLYVANYVEFTVANHKNCTTPEGLLDYCGPSAYPPSPDDLYLNRGDGTFERLELAARGPGLGVVAVDVTGDSALEIVVANDQSENHLWMREGERWVENAQLAGLAVNSAGRVEASMGIAARDDDGDGDLDLLFTHLSNESNTLYRNQKRLYFDDATNRAKLGSTSWALTGFGVAWEDFDGDGHADLYIANGEVRLIREQHSAGIARPFQQPDLLYPGIGGHQYGPPVTVAGTHDRVGRGVAAGDVDNDGDTDLIVANNHGAAQLLLNQSQERRPRPWKGFELVADPARALGSVVRVRSGSAQLSLRSSTDGSYASCQDDRVLVPWAPGLVDGLVVNWADGTREAFLPTDQTGYQRLEYGQGEVIGAR